MILRDPVSSLSHLFTAAWAVLVTGVMLRMEMRAWHRRFPVAVYGLSMVLLFLASGIFHALFFESEAERRFYQKLDQTAIYLLIAGTNTPIMVFVLHGRFRARMLTLLWGFAAVGVGCQWLLPKAPYAAMVGVCMGMGWAGLVPLLTYYRALGWRAMNWVWLGAAFYTAGSICELCAWPTLVNGWVGPHDFFHFCISAGNIAFCGFIIKHVIGYYRPVPDAVPA
jgi:hemolysin III